MADYVDAISGLELVAVNISHAGVTIEVGTVLLWAYFLPESVERDIRQLKPHALAILSYYAVFLAALDDSFWYLRGRGKELLKDIDDRLQGQANLRELLEWPKMHVV